MSENTRTPLKPAGIRRRALALMKQCWKTLLIAAVLMSLFTWVEDAVKAYGDKLATEAYNAHMEAFHAENPAPSDESIQKYNAYMDAFGAVMNGTASPDELPESDADTISYFLSMRVAQYDADDAYEKVFAPWKLIGYAIDLLDLLFSCIIAVRLCRGLLSALRGGECTPHCLLSGWERTSTACWLAVQTTLRVLGWSLLPLIIYATLSYFFGGLASTISSLLMTLVALWASLHYALAEVHLADSPDRSFTASDCLRYAVDDADAFGIWQMCRVLWPLAVIFAANIALGVAAVYAPLLTIPAEIISIAATLFTVAMRKACYVCIYDEMRQRAIAAQEAMPASEGLARARALAAPSPED